MKPLDLNNLFSFDLTWNSYGWLYSIFLKVIFAQAHLLTLILTITDLVMDFTIVSVSELECVKTSVPYKSKTKIAHC